MYLLVGNKRVVKKNREWSRVGRRAPDGGGGLGGRFGSCQHRSRILRMKIDARTDVEMW